MNSHSDPRHQVKPWEVDSEPGINNNEHHEHSKPRITGQPAHCTSGCTTQRGAQLRQVPSWVREAIIGSFQEGDEFASCKRPVDAGTRRLRRRRGTNPRWSRPRFYRIGGARNLSSKLKIKPLKSARRQVPERTLGRTAYAISIHHDKILPVSYSGSQPPALGICQKIFSRDT